VGKRIVVIGDSVVYGRVDPANGGWVGRLRTWFEPLKPQENAVFNLGVGGDNTSKVLERFRSECLIREPDLILVQVGANDFRQEGSSTAAHEVPPDQFSENVSTLIQLGQELSQVTIIVGMVPVDESRTTRSGKRCLHFLSAQLKYAEMTQEQCNRNGVPYIDNITQWLRLGKSYLGLGKAKYTKLLADGVHPNADGHELLYGTVKSFLKDSGYV